MTGTELQYFLTETLGDTMNKKGQALYSGLETLTKGEYYFLGFNPAADGTNPLLRDLPFERKNWSAYAHQCWTCGSERNCRDHDRELHQRQVLGIMNELKRPPEETFATNLIFVESKKSKDIYSSEICKLFWPVHKRFLGVVRPEYIVCLGYSDYGSSFSVVRGKAARKGKIETEGRGVGRWKRFEAVFDVGDGSPLETMVIGVWHPSYQIKFEGLRDFLMRPVPDTGV
jgi:hypothetical protein